MADSNRSVQAEVNPNHRRVISVRMRLLEESCLRLLDLFCPVESALTSRSQIPPEKAERLEPLVTALRAKIAETKSELGLESTRRDAQREASAQLAAMNVNVEGLHPDYLKGYGAVPEAFALYLEIRIQELLHLLKQINRVLEGNMSEVDSEDQISS